MGAVLPFRRRAASRAVIGKLVELGYLRQAKRYNDGVVERALQRLRLALQRDGLICDKDHGIFAILAAIRRARRG